MLDKFTYTNHLGEVITFGDFPYFANQSDLRDYQWLYDENITKFDRGTVSKTLKVCVVGTEKTANNAKDNLYEIFEKDVLAMKKGTFAIGDYKMNAFVYGSKKINYLSNQRLLVVELSIVTDTPQWKIEKTYTFDKASTGQRIAWLNNESFCDCGFRLKIHGTASKPWVFIQPQSTGSSDDKLYEVDVDIASGEHLEIVSDGTTKTVTLHKNNGTTEDCFARRYKGNSIFAKIKAGKSLIQWSDDFDFELTLIEERGEPKWT